MPDVLVANAVTLSDIHHRLKMDPCWDGDFSDYLQLHRFSEGDYEDLLKIRQNLLPYLESGTMTEGSVKLLILAPLMRLAGFYQAPFQILVEERVSDIAADDEDIEIHGRMDLLVLKKTPSAIFWIVIVEAKSIAFSAQVGLAQLLAYTYQGLQQQPKVWGLVTNGLDFRFVLVQQGDPITYHPMPLLNLLELEGLIKILQVLNGIRDQL